MKIKPVAWILIIVTAGLAGWLISHSTLRSLRKTETFEKTQRPSVEQRIRQARSFKYNAVHPPAAAVASLSADVQPIITSAAAYSERLAAAHNISTNLSQVDLEALYSFLLTPAPDDEDQNAQVLKNELMDGLCALQPPPLQLADLLSQIYHDRTQNEIIRDYAVQHLATFYLGMKSEPEEMQRIRSFELAESETVLWEGLSETDGSIAGTALLGLARLAQSPSDVDEKSVAEAALKLAQDDHTGELAQITVLQVCAKFQVAEALPLALNDAQQAASEPLRISAIGALATLGGSEQIAFLNTLIQGTDERLKFPAQHALNQINLRLRPASQGH